MPGVHFGGYFSSKGINVSAAASSSASNSPRPSLTDQFLTSMTKFHQIGTPRSETGSISQAGGQSWYQLPPRPPTQPADLPLEPSGMRSPGNQLTQLSRSLFPGQTEQTTAESMRIVARPYDQIPAATSKARPPPPPEFEPTVPSSTDTRSVEEYPWWERYYDGADVNAGGEGPGGVYHFRTRLRNNRVGLLIDPGAHGNLIGSETAARLEQQTESIGARSSRPLHRPLSVRERLADGHRGSSIQHLDARGIRWPARRHLHCSSDSWQHAASSAWPRDPHWTVGHPSSTPMVEG